jgi:hypothetical protein
LIFVIMNSVGGVARVQPPSTIELQLFISLVKFSFSNTISIIQHYVSLLRILPLFMYLCWTLYILVPVDPTH